MTAFILLVASHPRNNLFMMLVKVKDVITVILSPRKEGCIWVKKGRKKGKRKKVNILIF